MAYLNICGFETGDLLEAISTSGTLSAQGTTKRTGAYALKLNPTAGTAFFVIAKYDGNGQNATLGTANVYSTLYLNIGTLPGADCEIMTYSGTTHYFRVVLKTTGALQLQYINSGAVWTNIGSASSALSSGTWYRIEFSATNTATGGSEGCELKLDGSVVATGTGLTTFSPGNINYLYLGNPITGGATYVIYYDDIAVSDSAYPGAGQVNILKPNATGNYTAWTDGAGTAPTNVAEVPHDSDTSYITSSTNAQAETEALDSAATGGVAGTIGTVKSVTIARSQSGNAFHTTRTRSGTTDQDTGNAIISNTYVLLAKLNDTDPATSAAWTSSGVDGLEVGAVNGGIAVNVTAIYAMVWSTGAVPGPFTNPIMAAVTRVAELGSEFWSGSLRLLGMDAIYGDPGQAPSIVIPRAQDRPNQSYPFTYPGQVTMITPVDLTPDSSYISPGFYSGLSPYRRELPKNPYGNPQRTKPSWLQ